MALCRRSTRYPRGACLCCTAVDVSFAALGRVQPDVQLVKPKRDSGLHPVHIGHGSATTPAPLREQVAVLPVEYALGRRAFTVDPSALDGVLQLPMPHHGDAALGVRRDIQRERVVVGVGNLLRPGGIDLSPPNTERPVCIVAGAGTGKTTTITRRIAHQVRTGTFLDEIRPSRPQAPVRAIASQASRAAPIRAGSISVGQRGSPSPTKTLRPVVPVVQEHQSASAESRLSCSTP